MKRCMLLALLLLVVLSLPGCGGTEDGPEGDGSSTPRASLSGNVNTASFVEDYNKAAALTGGTPIDDSWVEPMTVDGEAQENSFTVSAGLDGGILMIEPGRVWIAGMPSDADLVYAEYQAMVMAVGGLDAEAAEELLNGLIPVAMESEEGTHTTRDKDWEYHFRVTSSGLFSFSISG